MRSLRRTTTAAAASLVLLTAGCGGGSGTEGVVTLVPEAQRVRAPELAGPLLDGGTLDPAAYDGRVVVVNAWGSWCGPCREEVDDLEQVRAATADEGVAFLGLTVKDEPDSARAFVRQRGVSYPSVSPGEPVLLGFGSSLPATAPPTTWVIDADGRVAARVTGAVRASTLQGIVDDVLAEAA
jgi:thiol-disulfide isomerase/thioredoxin